MPTRNINLTREQDAFVDEVVASGEYQNASEAMRDAVRALQQRRQEDRVRLELLRAEVKLGVDAIRRGDYAELDAGGMRRWMESLIEPRRPTKRRR